MRLLLLPDVPWERIVERYALADVFALLSRHEPWGVVVNEAAACGLPLVLSDRVGAAYDLLEDGRNGRLVPVDDAHLCCGSAGTYALLQPQIAGELRARKLASLQAGAPEVIATANIGCLAHLAGGASRPVRHWIEVLDDALSA